MIQLSACVINSMWNEQRTLKIVWISYESTIFKYSWLHLKWWVYNTLKTVSACVIQLSACVINYNVERTENIKIVWILYEATIFNYSWLHLKWWICNTLNTVSACVIQLSLFHHLIIWFLKKIKQSIPMYSPFSRESRGQNEARMLCILGDNLSEQRRVKYPWTSKAILESQHKTL